MIIFGTTGIKSTVKSGHFNCPQCEQNKPYRHRKVTQFFTLYFIPLIPLGNKGEYVECGSCKGTFVTRIIDNPSTNKDEFMSIYQKAIRHSMVMMMLADGEIDQNEKVQVLSIINKFGHNDINMADLDNLIVQIQKENQDVTTYLKKIASSLNEHGKEIIIKCAISVAASDGNVDRSELDMIAKMSQALDMSASHLKGIINEMMEPDTSFSKN